MGMHLRGKPTGGKRPGAGRPKGVKDKKPRGLRSGTKKQKLRHAAARVFDEIREEGNRKGELPLERLMRRMNDPTVNTETRDELAKAAAPYVHAKLSSVAVRPGVSPVDADGKPTQNANTAAGKGRITISMDFDNKGEIKDGEEEKEE